MKIFRVLGLFVAASMLAIALAGCGGSGGGTGQSGEPVEQLASGKGSAIHVDAANEAASVDVTVAEGEALFIMANFEENEGEATATTYKDGEEYMTDYFYDGYGCSETEVDPGDYTVKIDGAGAVGTMWVLSYPAGQIDFATMETEEIVEKVLADVA